MTDSGGLYLEISPAGSKRWFWKFYPEGKESRLALGSYPEVTLKAARAARDEAKKLHQAGANPVQQRRADRLASRASSATTFEAVAREHHETKKAAWSELHAAQWLQCCSKDLFPYIGSLPVADITGPVLLATLKRVQARGALRTAHDLREFAGQVFRHAIVTGRAERNPASDLRGALVPFVERHVGAVVDPKQAAELLWAIDGYKGQPTTRAALVLSALLFQRPGNIRAMEWAHVDKEVGMWTIPASLMKRTVHGKTNGRPHFVPLVRQAIAMLDEMRPLTGHGRFVFPSLLSAERCMSENTLRSALRRMGYANEEMTAHGFRAMARTIMREQMPGVDMEAVEAQLAHGKKGPLGDAYDRAEFMTIRRNVMQTWADYIDHLRDGAQVIQFPERAA